MGEAYAILVGTSQELINRIEDDAIKLNTVWNNYTKLLP
jgi:hypothetical protein